MNKLKSATLQNRSHIKWIAQNIECIWIIFEVFLRIRLFYKFSKFLQIEVEVKILIIKCQAMWYIFFKGWCSYYTTYRGDLEISRIWVVVTSKMDKHWTEEWSVQNLSWSQIKERIWSNKVNLCLIWQILYRITFIQSLTSKQMVYWVLISYHLDNIQYYSWFLTEEKLEDVLT